MDSDEALPFKERQDDEFEILQSIYNDDIIDLRKNDAWKVSRPPEFLLKLRPQEGMSGRKDVCYLDLKVKFHPRYPECSPDLKIEDSKGISSDDQAKLEKELKKFCNSSVGEVMILQVALLIQEFLHKHNVPVPSIPSFHEQMMQNQQKQLEKEAKEETERKLIQQQKEELQRRQIEEALTRIEEEKKKLRRMVKDEREVTAVTGSADNSSWNPSGGVAALEFNKKTPKTIFRGQYLGSGSSGSVVYMGMDSATGQAVAVHHWTILCPTHSSIMTLSDRSKLDKLLKAISTVDQEIHSLVKLSHPNIAAYITMRNAQAEKSIEVDVLQEYVLGISLQQKITSRERVPLDVLRCYTDQMLMALDYLHSKSVVHKQFKASSVFLDSQGVIRVADFSIGKRLVDLYNASRIEQHGVRFSDDRIPFRIGKKDDVLRLGLVVLSLAQGHMVTDFPPDVSSAFTPVFQDFLEKCLTVDERLRSSASELLQHDFIKPSVTEPSPPWDETEALNSMSDDEEVVCPEGNRFETPPRTPKLSRLHSEFQELEWLGKGGYGDVVKVRNKLDDRCYAIKRILLKPSQSQLNKKITREVKLLSRLNHENVVRYYNSWIETIQSLVEDLSTNSSNFTSTTESKPSPEQSTFNSLGLVDDIEKFAPPPVQSSVSEWSMSLEEVSRRGDADDDDEDDDMFKTIYLPKDDSSESVLFDRSSDDSSSDGDFPTTTATSTTETDDSAQNVVIRRFLYIQMEYCEKSTLRDTIDCGLCHEQDRMWRLFREILEGLIHVHQQGMIHRDLKPQNIFLDRNDHVKIGDFGLATSRSRVASSNYLEEANARSEAADSTYTGAVGTGLYVAPEILMTSSKRTLYSQKVDIYSLGIIFFEMSYPGISTKMERVKVLGGLRTPSILFPPNFNEVSMEREVAITKWCLNHEPRTRPTALELLKCRWVPTPVLEESDVLDAVREMLSDHHSKQHRLIMDELFNQPMKPIDSVVYDYELYRHRFSSSASLTQQHVFRVVSSIMERHGAVCVLTPLLLSRLEFETGTDAASFMGTGGTVVTLPYNLRVPFARFLVCHGISNLKRFAIEKVYRARKIRDSRPKEIWECAFDIVTPTSGGMIPDAEVILLVSEIISHFPVLSARKYTLRVNHVMAIKAFFKHCGLEEDHHKEALAAILASDGLSKSQIDACLSSLPLTLKQMSALASFIQVRGSFSKVQSMLRGITKNKSSEASSWARQSLHEMELLKKNLDAFQVTLPVTFDLGFSLKYHEHYNGIIFQISAEVQRKRHTAIDTLAVGGRYDKLLESFDYVKLGSFDSVKLGMMENKEQDAKRPLVVGVSIAIEKVVAAMTLEAAVDGTSLADEGMTSSLTSRAPVDVVVCSSGRLQNTQDRLRVVRMLWTGGIKAETVYERNPAITAQEMQDKAQERGVRHLVVLNDKESFTVKSFVRDQNTKPIEHKVLPDKLVEYLKRPILNTEDGNPVIRKSVNQALSSSGDPPHPAKPTNHGGTRHLSIEILPPDRLAFNTKKRYEYEVGNKLSNLPIIASVSGRSTLCAVAVDLPSPVMKLLACHLDVSHSEDAYFSSAAHHLQAVSRYKKYMAAITDKVAEVKFDRKITLVMLYSYKDDGYCLLV